MIKSVYGLKLNDVFLHQGNLFKVKYFPTRNMVCADSLHAFCEPCPSHIKITRMDVNISFVNRLKSDAKLNKSVTKIKL